MGKLLLSLTIALVILVAPNEIAAQPDTAEFYGTVRLNGRQVPDGTTVTATIEGSVFRCTVPCTFMVGDEEQSYGRSTYVLQIGPRPGQRFADGSVLTFQIDDHLADQTITWDNRVHPGGSFKLHLTASFSPTTRPTPTPTPWATPTVSTPTPMPTPVLTATPTPTPPETEDSSASTPARVAGTIVGASILALLALAVWRFITAA